MSEQGQLFSPSSAAKELGISKQAVLKWCRTGRLRSQRVGNTNVIKRADLERFRRWYKEHEPAQQQARKGVSDGFRKE